MIIKICSGRRALRVMASVMICPFFCTTAHAWQQEYIVDAQPGHNSERYTWDSDHQPDYDEILAQRIHHSQNVPGLSVSLAEDSPLMTLTV